MFCAATPRELLSRQWCSSSTKPSRGCEGFLVCRNADDSLRSDAGHGLVLACGDGCLWPTGPESLWTRGVSHLLPRLAAQSAPRARHEGQVAGRTPRRSSSRTDQLCRQCSCSPHLLGHLVRSLLVLLRFPHVLSPGPSGSILTYAPASSFTTCTRA